MPRYPTVSARRGLSLLTSPTHNLVLHLEWTHSVSTLTPRERQDILEALDHLRSYILRHSRHPSPLISLSTEPPLTS